MAGVAILTCQPNSHPFNERHISLLETIKIGRSVARARPASNNGIFDCKVLSRNHAMLWYENGKFFLQDTKSSNGTFINSQRLCKGGEESPAREIFSGDQIQFGVDVMENNRRGEKITHGCIIATVTLFHPDGREAKNIYSDSSPFANTVTPGFSIQSQDLYQLAQYLQEALHREKMLEQKLSSLQQLVDNTHEASESGWQALITEDRLLSRLDVLESQLHIHSKNHSEDTLRQEVVTLQEDKLTYETTAKESLRKVLQEKLEAVRKLTDLESSLLNTESECAHLKDVCEKSQEELQQLAEKYQDQLKEVKELQDKLQDAEREHSEQSEKVEIEKRELNEKLDETIRQENILSAKVESLQADNDIARNQLAAMKAKLEALKEDSNKEEEEDIKENGEEDKSSTTDTDNKFVDSDEQPEIIPTSQKDTVLKSEDVEGKLKATQLQIEKYKSQLEESDNKLKESKDKVDQLQSELDSALAESRQYTSKIASLEDKLRLSDMHMNQMMENTMADLNLQLKESHRQSDGSNELIKGLQEKISVMENDMHNYGTGQADVTLVSRSNDLHSEGASHNHVANSLEEDENLKALLQEARELQRKADIELSKCRTELDETKTRADKADDTAVTLREQLTEAQKEVKDQSAMVIDLQEQLKRAESSTKEVKQQILDLRDRLLEEQALARSNQEEVQQLKSQLEQEKTRYKDTKKELDESKRSQSEAQQSAKQSHNEAEQLKNKVRHLQERLETDRRQSSRDSHHSRLSHSESTHTTKQRAEFLALKEECTSLRKRIQAIEAEMKMSRKENLQLSSEYNKLQESYKHLEALKEKLEHKENDWKSNLTDSQKETAQARQELDKAEEEIAKLKLQWSEEYKQLADRSKMLSFCSSIPLLMLLFGILMALYPSLAQITATTT